MEFSVSIIIPVYNGEKFIAKAIKSALQQIEVTEIIIVNDGSTDNTDELLKELQKKYNNIKVLYHNNKVNRGRAASRNLGVKNASGNYIAFLDADDFYLPQRFISDKKQFKKSNKIDGVYNAIGVHFYREASLLEKDRLKLTTIKDRIKPEDLFEVLLNGKSGHFSIDGLTVKASVFDRIGYFNEALTVAEDTEMFFKMALACSLETGIIDKPVAIRGVHDNNVFNKGALYKANRMKMYESIVFWASKNKIPLNKIDLLLKWLWLLRFKQEKVLVKNISYWGYLFMNNPKILFSTLSIKYFPLIRLRKKIFPLFFR